MTIAERIAATEAKHAALRAKRGADALDGRKVNAAEIAAVEAELEALSDAAAEEVRRERAVASHARRSRRAEQAERLKELAKTATEALQASEEGFRQGAGELAKALATYRLMASEMRELNDTAPMPLQPIAAAGRLSNRVLSVLGATFRSRLGNIPLRATPDKPETNWAVAEAKALAPYLDPIFKEQKS